MPLKQRVTPEMILQAAFDVLKRDGMEGVNARSIAREAQCSTQPVFSCFPTLNDIKTEIVARTAQSYTDTIEPAFQSEQPLEEACRAHIHFAHENPKLFLHLFVNTQLGNDILFVDLVLHKSDVENNHISPNINPTHLQMLFFDQALRIMKYL